MKKRSAADVNQEIASFAGAETGKSNSAESSVESSAEEKHDLGAESSAEAAGATVGEPARDQASLTTERRGHRKM